MRTLRRAALALVAIAVVAAPAAAQAKALRVPFSSADFGKLRWLEGSWAGTSPTEQPLYERVHFVNDSTVEFSYYRDAGFARPTATGRLYLSAGRIYHTFGSNQWVATRAGEDGIYLVPMAGARNNFAWTVTSPTSWTSTMRTGIGGHERVIVYQMKRVNP
jgi:hypothetical protein